MPQDVQTLVSRNDLAIYLGISLTTLKGFQNKGMPSSVSAGKYPLQASIEWLINYKTQEALKTGKAPAMTEDDAKARKTLAEAQLKELELAEARGEVVNIADAEKELERYFSVVRASLLSFPARFAPFAVMVADEKTARQLIDKHISDMMTDIVNQTEALPQAEGLDDEEEDEA